MIANAYAHHGGFSLAAAASADAWFEFVGMLLVAGIVVCVIELLRR